MRRGRLVWCATIFLALGTRITAAGDLPSAKDQADLAWFERTGLPTGDGKAWVHAETGFLERGDPFEGDDKTKREASEVVEGFLLEDGPDSFTVLPRNLLPRVISRTKPDWAPPAGPDPGWVAADFEDDARRFLAALADGSARAAGGIFGGFEGHPGLRGEAFGLAQGAVARGRISLGHDLLEAARRIPDSQGRIGRPLVDMAAEDLGIPVFGRIILDFGRPEVSRHVLRDRLKVFVAGFGASEHAERARGMLEVLERMVVEDDAHASEARTFETLSRDEQIHQLVFELRDQNGCQMMQPGSPSIWLDPREERSPADRLVTLGFDAVPVLIPAIEDGRWTRTVGYWRNFHFSHYVLTVGDAALAVIEKIAGRSFWQGGYTAASMAKDGQAAETRKRVEAWWTELQAQGEARQLVETLAAGGDQAVAALYRLKERYPTEVPAAVVLAMPLLKDPRERFNVLQALDDVLDPRVTEILLAEVRDGPTLDCRARAAWDVVDRGHPEVAAMMRREWEGLLRFPPWTTFDMDFGFGLLVGFLGVHGGPEGIRAIAEALPGLAPDVAVNALEHLPDRAERLAPAEAAALEDLYAAALDEDATTGASTSWGSGRSIAIRVCDSAAERLAALRGDRTAFEIDAEEIERDRRIGEMRASWRARRGLASTEAPADRPPLNDEILEAAISAALAAVDPAARRKAIAALEALGPRAAPAVERAASASSLARTLLGPVAQQLAVTVARTEAEGVPAPIADRLRGMESKPLDPTTVRDLLRDAASSAPEGRVRVRLLCRWGPDGAGFSILLEVRRLLGGLGDGFGWFSDIDSRGAAKLPSGTRVVRGGAPDPSDTDCLREILAALVDPASHPPIDQPVIVEASLTRQPSRR